MNQQDEITLTRLLGDIWTISNDVLKLSRAIGEKIEPTPARGGSAQSVPNSGTLLDLSAKITETLNLAIDALERDNRLL